MSVSSTQSACHVDRCVAAPETEMSGWSSTCWFTSRHSLAAQTYLLRFKLLMTT